MQVLEAVVSHGRVEFRGEGGEIITVTMAAGPILADEELIAKSKVMLLHAANFTGESDPPGEPMSSTVAAETPAAGQEAAGSPPAAIPGVP
jgi:hypothetical protein